MNNLFNRFFLIFPLLTAVEALAAPSDPVFPNNGEVERQNVHLPAQNVEAIAELGNTLISKRIVTRTQWVQVARDAVCDPPGQPGVFIFSQGGRVTFDQENKDGLIYNATGTFFKMFGARAPVTNAKLLISLDEPLKPKVAIYQSFSQKTIYECPALQLELKEKVENESSLFRQELVYTGISKNVVALTYREFSNDLARQAFTQELKFDLGEGEIVGFKGARIKILSANNVEIRYQVLKPLE